MAKGDIMPRLDMVFVSSGKATMCTKTLVDRNLTDSDHAGVRIWLDICEKQPRGPGLFKVNGSLLEDPAKLLWSNENINTVMQQLDPTWNPHLQLDFFKVCVRSTLLQLGQMTSSLEVTLTPNFALDSHRVLKLNQFNFKAL
jgi:hypothetical protein